MRGGSISAAAFALAVSAIVWHFASPLWTVNQMRAAAEARDAVALAAHVDFHALADSATAAASEGLASPAGVQLLFVGEARAAAEPRTPLAGGEDGFAIKREGFSTFRVVGRDDRAAALVFRRHGHVWKLAGIDLPPGAAASR